MSTKQINIITIALYLVGVNIVIAADTEKKNNTPLQNSPPVANSSSQSAKSGGADIEVEEVRRFIYSAKMLRDAVQIATIGDTIVPGQNQPHVDFAPLFFGKGVVFKGNMVDYVAGLTDSSGKSYIVSAAAIDYIVGGDKNKPLSEVGVVQLDNDGFVTSPGVKSGWVNMETSVDVTDSGVSRKLRFDGITFWVTDGGIKWLSFTVKQCITVDGNKDGQEMPVSAQVSQDGKRVTIKAGQYAFVPELSNLKILKMVRSDADTKMK